MVKEELTFLTFKEKLLKAGMKCNDIDNHCSDLYCLKNEISDNIVDKYEFRYLVKTFISEIDGKEWYEIPFAYTEYFKNRSY